MEVPYLIGSYPSVYKAIFGHQPHGIIMPVNEIHHFGMSNGWVIDLTFPPPFPRTGRLGCHLSNTKYMKDISIT